jgi:hypothetical protein
MSFEQEPHEKMMRLHNKQVFKTLSLLFPAPVYTAPAAAVGRTWTGFPHRFATRHTRTVQVKSSFDSVPFSPVFVSGTPETE